MARGAGNAGIGRRHAPCLHDFRAASTMRICGTAFFSRSWGVLVLFSGRWGGGAMANWDDDRYAKYIKVPRVRGIVRCGCEMCGGRVVVSLIVYICALYINFVMPRPASRMYSGALGARCV